MIGLVLTNRFCAKLWEYFTWKLFEKKFLPTMKMKFYNKLCPKGVCSHFVSALFKCAVNMLAKALNKLLHNPAATPKRKEAAKGK